MIRWSCTAALLLALVSLGLRPAAGEDRFRLPPEPPRSSVLPAGMNASWPARNGSPIRQAATAGPAAEGARAEPGLTLEDLEAIALEHNPTLVQAEMRVRAAEGKYLQAGLYPNPVFGYQAEDINDAGTAGQQGAFFGQEVVTAGKRRLGRAVAGHEVDLARHASEAQRRRVLNDVRAAFYEVLVAQKTVELDEQLGRIGDQGAKAAQQLFSAQEVSRVDVLQARIEADFARLKLHNARNRHQAAWRQLAAVAGLARMEPGRLLGELEDELPEMTWEDAIGRLLAESPQLAQAQAGVQRARCQLAKECAHRVPNVDLEAAVRYNNVSEQTVASVEVGMPLPIFNRNQGNIQKAQAELIAAEQEVQRVKLQLHDRLAAAYRKYADARYQAEIYAAEILPNARDSLELVRTGYQQGEFGYLILLTAQRTFFRVNLAYLEALRQLRLSTVDIEGMLLRGGLQGGFDTNPG